MNKEHPIIFSTEMIQAYIAGRKTQTRRIIKPQLPFFDYDFYCEGRSGSDVGYSALTRKGYVEVRGYEIKENGERHYNPFMIKPKLGKNGHKLWFKETFFAFGKWIKNGKTKSGKQKYIFKIDIKKGFKYLDNPPEEIEKGRTNKEGWYKRPALFMPRIASRFNPKITRVRIERLLNISEEDAIAEGIEFNGLSYKNYFPEQYKNPLLGLVSKYPPACISYFSLWNKINGKDSHKLNPYVWVLDFEGPNL